MSEEQLIEVLRELVAACVIGHKLSENEARELISRSLKADAVAILAASTPQE